MKVLLVFLLALGFVPLAFAQINPIPIDTGIIKDGIAAQVNQYRTQQGLNTWSYDSGIQAAATTHSQDLINSGTFTHNTPGTNINPGFRGSLSGYPICGDPQSIDRYNQVGNEIKQYQTKKVEYENYKSEVEPVIQHGLAPNIHELYNNLIGKSNELDSMRNNLNPRIDEVNSDIDHDKIGIGFSENMEAFENYNLVNINQLASFSFQDWINSPDHKAVLDGYGSKMGIGIAFSLDRMVITLDIC